MQAAGVLGVLDQINFYMHAQDGGFQYRVWRSKDLDGFTAQIRCCVEQIDASGIWVAAGIVQCPYARHVEHAHAHRAGFGGGVKNASVWIVSLIIEREQGIDFSVRERIVANVSISVAAVMNAISPARKDVTIGVGDECADGYSAVTIGFPSQFEAGLPGGSERVPHDLQAFESAIRRFVDALTR